MTLQVNADGSFVMTSPKAFEGDRGQRVYYASSAPPKFTTDNYKTVLFSEGIGRSFMNSLTVTIPSTVIPILIAAFAAYALAWMRFPGRALLIAVIIGLLVVPLQMSLIPLLKLYNGVGAFFGVPVEDLSRHLAGAYRLRPALRHLSAEKLHCRPAARNHGIRRASTAPATSRSSSRSCCRCRSRCWPRSPSSSSCGCGTTCWSQWCSCGTEADQIVLTAKLNALLGSRGGDWEILTTSAFVTIIVPLIVFFSLQRYFVRGLLAGSVKGG